jgi:hypothetical protein
MKRRFSFLWVAFALASSLAGCGPSIQTTQTQGSALVTIEYYHASVEQIVHLLRAGRGKDITVSSDGSTVKAAFSQADTPAWKLAELLRDLNNLPGVLHVDLVENPRPIMQNF